ncbi:MAG: NADH-quinone oxidoreductase subunit C [Proteobacteria bacterium]|nr:NADH-quinone oxidoreductase subunit C [Pseudomonadota bacterium]MBU1593961.1 NADH-quinone oxidoreductase subunit C [Pseudomonadota bacterium]
MEALFTGLGALYLAKCDAAKTGQAFQAFLPAGFLVRAAERLLQADYHLEDICAVDCAEGYVVVYHFDHFETPGRLTLRVLAPHAAPTVPSIAQLFQGAEWHERETRDFHGVLFEGNPNFIPLLIDPDMADCFPLRKEEKARARAKDMLEAGEVVFCHPAFTLMTPDAPVEGNESGGAKPATA